MNAVEKSIQRHAKKLATKKIPPKVKVGWGVGMGWPELKDFDTRAEYVEARMAADPEYSPTHDGKLWMLV